MAATARPRDVSLEREAQGWMNDPYGHFGHDSTKIHSLPRAEDIKVVA